MTRYNWRECSCGSGFNHHELKDEYGFFIAYACKKCEEETRAHYRKNVMERPRPRWFAIHMEWNHEADAEREWARLNSPARDDYARDDISSAVMADGMRAAAEERRVRKFETALTSIVNEINYGDRS